MKTSKILAVAALSLAAAVGVHAEEYQGVQGSVSALSRAEVQTQAVAAAQAKDQNVSSAARVASKVISTLQNPVDVRAAAQGNANKL